MRSSATRRSACTVTATSAITARMSCLRSRSVVVGASKTARTSAPAVVIQASSCSVNATGRRARWAARSFSAARTAASLASRHVLQCPCHQTVLRLDVVELAQRPVGLVAGAFDASSNTARSRRWWASASARAWAVAVSAAGSSTVEQLVEDRVLQPDATDALADVLAGVELFGAGAHVARAVALGARVRRSA